MEDLFVPTAEAAFIAGVTDREMNRAVDEHILPDALIRSDNGRRFARLGAVLASFYFKTEDVYAAPFRRKVLVDIVERLQPSRDRKAIYALRFELPKDSWRIEVSGFDSVGVIRVDLARFVDDATRRMKEIERAQNLISSDPEILGGTPVFTGTRVPIDSVVASLNKGIDPHRILKSYPSLTEEHLRAA